MDSVSTARQTSDGLPTADVAAFRRGLSAGRITALLQRQLFLYRRSLLRSLEIVYWPVMDLLVWGFLSVYVGRLRGGGAAAIAFLLGGMILWDIFFRVQQAISVSFLEDVWTRNLVNVFVSPISTAEFLCATMLLGVMKIAIVGTLLAALALLLYSFNIFHYGLPLLPFILNLIVAAWGMGIITTALILRFGQGAEVLAWAVAFLFQPFSAVFYPVAVLPPAIQRIAWLLPTTHAFEGMRVVLGGGPIPWAHVGWAAATNVVLLAIAVSVFAWVMHIAREMGLLLRTEG
ncbi:MAG TPA: ABC transporter permease [bacterium]|nr:ABC transporter permease [bacterium]